MDKTEMNLNEMENLVKLAGSDKVTEKDKQTIQKEIERVISRLKKDETKLYDSINSKLDQMIRQVAGQDELPGRDGGVKEFTGVLERRK